MVNVPGPGTPAEALNVTETLLQTPLFASEWERYLFLRDPQALPPGTVESRNVLVGAATRLVEPQWTTGSERPDADILRRTAVAHATELRMAARQLIMLQRLEQYVANREEMPADEVDQTAPSTDLYAGLVRFLQTPNPAAAGVERASVYDVLAKNGLVVTETEAHKDHVMATILNEAGICKPASEQFPAPLRALVITPTDRDTFRLAFRRRGNSTFAEIAPDVRFITTERYHGLVKDQGPNIVVTSPGFLEEALLSGRMTDTKFDLILSESLTPGKRNHLTDMIHAQRVGPTVIHFAFRASARPTETVIGDQP